MLRVGAEQSNLDECEDIGDQFLSRSSRRVFPNDSAGGRNVGANLWRLVSLVGNKSLI